MKTPKYLHVVLKDETVRRFNYDGVNFHLSANDIFVVTEEESERILFVTPKENLYYYECNDCEYSNRVWREGDGNESTSD